MPFIDYNISIPAIFDVKPCPKCALKFVNIGELSKHCKKCTAVTPIWKNYFLYKGSVYHEDRFYRLPVEKTLSHEEAIQTPEMLASFSMKFQWPPIEPLLESRSGPLALPKPSALKQNARRSTSEPQGSIVGSIASRNSLASKKTACQETLCPWQILVTVASEEFLKL